uniref:SGNH hydrolase-type esterase domain-containing protein n=1 Tax=Chromera velia CCMP2878 TaxID=1169474 RepID=A0A0G4HNQ0_9ALVE|mmetsp:Transcript_56163/g.109960  ORF Transcript_56163/g.109960 Transcript_56163/m.109960 type:complete len:328 (-) Transcript_56163:95-1078(-)|eukprot:Cvel_29611.t1-p1 / transcript=Cvel_29611.t1 / gene=Cvel_29611 / organism=Chromera_velia_CCMP2878 / gene_product=GDSL esterase/lipase At5g62930, putative / transcript_product=GDSL esterase/lipase At5g62930, putative / location=Cvel_scaffold4082:3670-4650(-) / protein_length=327 / sequence_SO=supercontig / SO=protein_coding / is_pseudo=false
MVEEAENGRAQNLQAVEGGGKGGAGVVPSGSQRRLLSEGENYRDGDGDGTGISELSEGPHRNKRSFVTTASCIVRVICLLAILGVSILLLVPVFMASEKSTGRRPKVVLFGDSITQTSFDIGDWGRQFASAYTRKADVINRGYSGYNSKYLRAIYPYVVPKTSEPFLLSLLFLGANDVTDESNPQQHMSDEEYETNMRWLLEEIRKSSRYVVIVAPPPVVHDLWKDRSNDRVWKFEQICKKLGEEFSFPVVQTFSRIIEDKNWPSLLVDGLHLNAEGAARLFGLLMETIKRTVPEAHPDSLPVDAPDWKNFDRNHPEKTVKDYYKED